MTRGSSLIKLFLVGLCLWACKNQEQVQTFSGDFFPLTPNSVWTYRVENKTAGSNFTLVDQVIGERYIPRLNLSGVIVEESSNMERAEPLQPLLYYLSGGYLTRLSALVNNEKTIEVAAFGAVRETKFLPQPLRPGQIWNDDFFPLGRIVQPPAKPFEIHFRHRTFAETEAVHVPAGYFRGCIRIESQATYEGGPYVGPALRLTFIDWYASSVGLVKSMILDGNSSGKVLSRSVLQQYRIGPVAHNSVNR